MRREGRAKILRKIADAVEEHRHHGVIYDINGNRRDEWYVELPPDG